MPRLTITGKPLYTDPEPQLSRWLRVNPLSSHEVGGTRDAATVTATLDTPDDAIIKVEYENGVCEWLRADQFAHEIGGERGASGAITVPKTLDRGATTRGLGWVLKALHVIGISPADALARETALGIVAHFDGKLQTGLYRLSSDGNFGDPITSATQLDNQLPYLVFLHGTASSTQGSFSGFWADDNRQQTAEWKKIVDKYGARILALEHATFSVSPAQNALDLAALLPANTTVHLVTHSRGGLVGELLGLGPVDLQDLTAFEGRDDQGLLLELGKLLGQKQIRVSKFVRTACPASGTILAAKRMDLYLNLLLNAIGLIPGINVSVGYEIFKATALELIKLRADPATMPGIEAMMPESPLIHFINTKGRSSKAELGVVAGNFEGSGVWGSLKTYALRAYYWEDNDIIVNTRSMTGGMERSSGVWEYFEEGDKVNHFHYFKNVSTRSKVLDWLSSSTPPSAYTRVRGIEVPATRGTPGEEAQAVLVPDLFGTELNAGGANIWMNYDALAAGQFTKLKGEDIQAGKPLDIYQPLISRLSLNHNVTAFGYDWRNSIESSAAALAVTLKDKIKPEDKFPVHLIGHGLGALVVREFAFSNNKDVWQQLKARGSKLVMLGAPLMGSWQVARLLWGRAVLVRMLALLGRQPASEIVAVLQSFQGLLDMLPDPMLDAQGWQASKLASPDPTLLAASRRWRRAPADGNNNFDNMFYIAGTAAATPSSLDEYTAAGDGHVAYSLATLPGLTTWYDLQLEHGQLPDAIEPLLEILSRGTASRLEVKPRSTAPDPDSERLRLQEEAVFFPGERDVLNAALGRPTERRRKESESVLRVRVTHGHLREARHPVAVGHYIGDAIVSAEASLDKALEQRLSNRFHMGIYAGPLGTVEIVRAAKAHPPGALVIGLGEVGELTSEMLRRAVLEACLRYALARAEDPAESIRSAPTVSSAEEGSATTISPGNEPQLRSAAISSILIGVSGGSFLSVVDSVTAITRAAIEANRTLSHRKLLDKVRIDEIEFIELYEDTAIEAAHAVARLRESLAPDLQAGERMDLMANLQQAPGGRFRKPSDIYSTGWWRRIQISSPEKRDDLDATRSASSPSTAATPATAPDERDACTKLVFAALTDRARIPETFTISQTKIASALVADSTNRTDYDRDAAVALFELLVPNPFKDQAREAADLVLMVDTVAAQYPWELMSDRMTAEDEPMAVRSGMIRQFKTGSYESPSGPRGARAHKALVIGDTRSSLPELPGARSEAQQVARLLQGHGYDAEPALIKQSAGYIVRNLFASDYRILHLAGHGIFMAGHPEKTGMVLADGIYLSPLEFNQLRNLPELVFVNCCHLGEFDNGRRLHTDYPGALAASVAQTLIQKGVKAVIAAGWAVDDTAAVTFATTFYKLLLEGAKFGEAVKQARRQAFKASSSNTWGSYQCYGNPDFALNLQPRDTSSRSMVFYSRRENIDELRDIAADARGSDSSEHQTQLRQRAEAIDKQLPSGWRDGEVLCLLAEAYRNLGRSAEAIKIFQEALAKPKAEAYIQAIEQLANCLDDEAQKQSTDPADAEKMWEDAQKILLDLNETIGKNHERLSLLGGLWKRRAQRKANPKERRDAFAKSGDFYRQAYEFNQRTYNEVNPYSGLNWMTMAYLSGAAPDEALAKASKECLARAEQPVDQPNFWNRVAAPDARLVDYLLKGTLAEHVDELETLYKNAFGFGAPVEIDKAIRQVRFIRAMSPSDALRILLGKIAPKSNETPHKEDQV